MAVLNSLRSLILLSIALLLTIPSFGQTAASDDSSPASIMAKEFGSGFKILEGQPVLTGDLDGDGAEDIVFVATGKNPLADSAGHNYKVIDPYDTYFGFGDPKVTSGFADMTGSNNPRYLLVIHDWKAPKSKAKFVIINLPFERLSMGTYKVKKKVVSAITAEESGGVAAAVFWDGKNYKWEAYGAN